MIYSTKIFPRISGKPKPTGESNLYTKNRKQKEKQQLSTTFFKFVRNSSEGDLIDSFVNRKPYIAYSFIFHYLLPSFPLSHFESPALTNHPVREREGNKVDRAPLISFSLLLLFRGWEGEGRDGRKDTWGEEGGSERQKVGRIPSLLSATPWGKKSKRKRGWTRRLENHRCDSSQVPIGRPADRCI